MKLDNIEVENMRWENEFEFEPVAQVQMRSVTGALVVFERAQPVGAPMTLSGGWATRSIVEQLQAKRESANTTHALELGNRTFEVIFDRSQPSIVAEQLEGSLVEPSQDDRYSLTLRLQVIRESTGD